MPPELAPVTLLHCVDLLYSGPAAAGNLFCKYLYRLAYGFWHH